MSGSRLDTSRARGKDAVFFQKPISGSDTMFLATLNCALPVNQMVPSTSDGFTNPTPRPKVLSWAHAGEAPPAAATNTNAARIRLMVEPPCLTRDQAT